LVRRSPTAQPHLLICRRCAARIGVASGRLATQPRRQRGAV